MEQKPIVVGITGGIGSGKTTLINWFEKDGIPVYNSDQKAKSLMVENNHLKGALIKEFGEEVFLNAELNKTYLAKKVFEDQLALKKINQLVHPFVFQDFNDWHANQKSNLVIKEAAILFESGAYKHCNWMVLVFSNQEKRLQRVMERDNTSREDILNRMSKQWSDEEKKAHSHFVVENNLSLEHFKEKYRSLFALLSSLKTKDKNSNHFKHPLFIE